MMCYNKPRKNQMTQSSEAKSYLDDIKLPLRGKLQLEVVKEVTPEVPRKIQKKIAKKVAACISAGIVASTSGFITLGETGHLPAQIQEWYDSTANYIRTIFGIEELKGKPAETITQETKPPEITTPETTAVSTTETTPETTTEVVVNAPEIAGLKFDNATKTYIAEAGNPYGLEAGTEAGVYTKEALKFNGEMEDAIGLKPEVIDYFQKQYLNEDTFFVPILIDLNETKGVEIDNRDNDTGNETIYSFGIRAPVGTKFYAVLSTKENGYTTGGVQFMLDSFITGKKKRTDIAIINSYWQYSFLDSKKKTPEGTFELKIGELIGQVNQKITGYPVDYEILFNLRKNSNDHFSSEILSFGDKKAYILSNETTVNAQNQS